MESASSLVKPAPGQNGLDPAALALSLSHRLIKKLTLAQLFHKNKEFSRSRRMVIVLIAPSKQGHVRTAQHRTVGASGHAFRRRYGGR